MKSVEKIKEKLNTKYLAREIIYLKEVRLYSRLYKREIKNR